MQPPVEFISFEQGYCPGIYLQLMLAAQSRETGRIRFMKRWKHGRYFEMDHNTESCLGSMKALRWPPVRCGPTKARHRLKAIIIVNSQVTFATYSIRQCVSQASISPFQNTRQRAGSMLVYGNHFTKYKT